MSTRLTTLCFDANDPLRLARFWAAALSWDIHDETDEEIGLMPTDGTRFLLLFLPVSEPKVGKNRIHLDLVSESPDHQTEMVDRLIAHARAGSISDKVRSSGRSWPTPKATSSALAPRPARRPEPSLWWREDPSCSRPAHADPMSAGGRLITREEHLP